MAIVSSIIDFDHAQKDGRRLVRERHTDNQGAVSIVNYVAETSANASTIMAGRVATLEAMLIAWELDWIATNLPEPPVLKYVTITQLGAYVRARFKDAKGPEVGRVAAWLLNRTDAQLRTAFGITQGQLDALKTRLQAMVDKYNASEAMVGE